MSNLKEIRSRISSVTTIRQVTSAMKMVSAAKLKKAQDGIIQIRPYADKMNSIIGTIASELDRAANSPFTIQNDPNKVLVVVIASNRGQCGAFNSNVIKRASELAEGRYASQLRKGKVHFLSIGKQGEKRLKTKGYKVIETAHHTLEKLNYESSSALANHLMDFFLTGKYDRIELVYNQFKNAAVQVLIAEQFLPVKQDMKKEEKSHEKYNFFFEPSEDEIIKILIPRSLKIQFFKALLDSNASEQGARMTAMHQATDNATDLLRELRLNYNKARQATITNEILEIVSGAEALKG
ncbi:MAG: ATP synthase F1 subunit gamma [Bacteroidota bacterium]|nr:ATP synthase F1 subunit gamma [Bacteroidota bacterium]MDP4206433.1 ATP synthase F1 subunit gamma [Bacteroidota bacterium]